MDDELHRLSKRLRCRRFRLFGFTHKLLLPSFKEPASSASSSISSFLQAFSLQFVNMASKQPSKNSVYKSAGGYKNFVESYGGKLWDSGDAGAIASKMQQYDSGSAGSAKSSGGSGSAKSSGGGGGNSNSGQRK